MPSDGLPQEVTVKPHMTSSSQTHWMCYKKWKVEWELSPDWNVSCRWSTFTFENSCGYTALGMPEWRETTEQTDWRAKQPSQVACFTEGLKCWEAWDTTCGHKAKDITPLITWRREALKEKVLDDLPWKDERGPSSIRQTLEPFQRQHWGNLWETGWNAYGLFRVHRYHLELNWTVQCCPLVLWMVSPHRTHGSSYQKQGRLYLITNKVGLTW